MVLLFFILRTNIFRAIQEKYDKNHISIKTALKIEGDNKKVKYPL